MKKKILPLAAAFLFFSMAPFFAAAQTTEERIETGRFGAEEPDAGGASGEDIPYKNRWLHLGLRAGPSLGIYIPEDDTAFTGGDSFGPSFSAGFQASVEIVPFFSVQAEAVFTWDKGSRWEYEFIPSDDDIISYQKRFSGYSLQIPLLAKLNFYPGKFRVSPFLGAYVVVPLGKMKVTGRAAEDSYTYSYPVPLGLLGGLSVGFPLGPGMLFADIRYTADLSGPELRDSGEMKTYIRNAAALSLGYEFALFKKR
ncbi:MAG: PorT family protein [Treponema sp.]|nr:PorT family protein [Treponema sp.]